MWWSAWGSTYRYEATEYGEAYMYVILPEAKVGSRYTHTFSHVFLGLANQKHNLLRNILGRYIHVYTVYIVLHV